MELKEKGKVMEANTVLKITGGNEELKALVLQTAERYVRAGLHIVCVHSAWCDNKIKRGKAPSHYAWQKDRLEWGTLREEILRVWSRERGCNIGLKTGKSSGLVCIDVDSKSGGLSWYMEHEDHLGSPIVERTHGGGLHLYYKYPKGVERLETLSSAKRLWKGVDILADGHGQVVTWPSIHASQELQYTMDRSLDLIDALEEADELPRWILDEIIKRASSGERAETVGSQMAEGDSLDVRAASLALKDLQGAASGQGGDLQTLKAAMICRDFGLNVSQVYELLLSEYNGRCSPPWNVKDLRDKVVNAFKYAKGQQGAMSISNAFTDEPSVPEAVTSGADRYSKKNAVHSAKVFLSRHKGRMDCYDGQLVMYDAEDHRWTVVSDGMMDSIIYRDIEKAEGDGELLRTLKASFLPDIRKIVKFELNKSGAIPDVHWRGKEGKDFISFRNGILDVQTGDLLNHSERWFCFQSVDLDYKDDAGCEGFLSFLNDVWESDAELIESLRLWMGYCLLSQANLQKFAVFKGASRAGKSTLVGVIEAMLGRSNCTSTSLSLIGSDFGLESLMGKKLCIFQDADRASTDRMGVATERIKSLASNDPLGINRKGQSVVNQRLSIKVAFVCNRMPPFLNDENALTNRMLVFPFWKSFEGREDFGLLERLEGEIQGVLNWALVGARRLLRGEKLVQSNKGREALQEIHEALDSVQGYIAEAVKDSGHEHNKVSTRALWESYREWCKDSGRFAKNKQKFFMEIGNHLLLKDRKYRTNTDRGFWGITIVSDIMGLVDETIDDSCPF